ncbi:hypothetical protein E3N88_39636 [Mikania micrantha]|uniref:Protein kinase domain-containing protein n=1 Tax=Mikania micrantha TaxID=192012 RepID=A0A5N6LXA3_9ASTR|nr:hypothetical protein E3N88_39636 [Mikania micrantha]
MKVSGEMKLFQGFLPMFIVLFGLIITSILVHAQNDQSGFISIDCGIDKGSTYTDNVTNINYASDAEFTDSGEIHNILPIYNSFDIDTQITTLRSFPQNTRNCYTLKPTQGKGNRYLIRLRFMYGNYDFKEQLPEFDVYLGPDYWDTIKFNSSSKPVNMEIIHVLSSDYIHVCLVNTGRGTPLISAIELRLLAGNMYEETHFGSLYLFARVNFGSAFGTVRYEADKYDRLWSPISWPNSTYLYTLDKVYSGLFTTIDPPSEVMSDAITPKYPKESFKINWSPDNTTTALWSIKSNYKINIKSWQGDPCTTQEFVWEGIGCSYSDSEFPRIVSMNLSSSGLNGGIDPGIANLTMLHTLDLSNNNLTGYVPDFLSGLNFLTTLFLKGNNFVGPIPAELQAKANKGSLSLSENTGNPASSCNMNACKNKKGNKIIVPVISSVASIFVIMIALIAIWMIKKQKEHGRGLDIRKQQYTYSEVQSITDNFSVVLGKGGFGTVYHGIIGDTQVAVKMLSGSSLQGDKEFQAEAYLLLGIHHKNLISLVGYCNDENHKGIIYEFMANGNLESHLFGIFYSWHFIFSFFICLEYLHHGCKPPIVHRDIKGTNILLNESFQAKLADFGLSKAFPTEGGTHISTAVAGTPGYLDPEYYTSTRLTEKSDVYSFGVVLLVVITGQPAITMYDNNNIHIHRLVNLKLAEGDINNIVDPRLQGDFDINSAWKAVELAMACVAHTPSRRPTMTEVVMELNDCLVVERARQETKPKKLTGLLSLNLEKISSALKIRDTPITFSDFYEKLVDHERTLQTSQPANLIATMNNTQRQGPRQYSRSSFAARNSNRPNSFGSRNAQSQNHNSGHLPHSRTNRNNLYCHFRSIPGHATKDCRKLSRFLQDNNINVSTNPTVNSSVSISSFPTSSLMFDTGASNHVTHDRPYLHNLSEYGGPDEIVLGNAHTGTWLHTRKQRYTYSEVQSITNNFNVVIGKGGFGTVYHGCIGHTQVAVKMLSKSSQQGEKEFQAEVNVLLNVHHRNLTSFVGYCNEEKHKAIIYEYMANGNLERHLFADTNSSILDWEERLQIGCDAAHGLEYLHHGCKPPIVHRDIKCTNILLNGTFQAKLADLGLSRAFTTEGDTHISTTVAGTPGYIDPEYYISNRLTEKSDVYSFGVVLLVIITGQPAITRFENDNIHISQWVGLKLSEGNLKNIVDPRVPDDYDINSAWKAVEVAMTCVTDTPNRRPTMNKVVMELNDCLLTERARKESIPGENESQDQLPKNRAETELVLDGGFCIPHANSFGHNFRDYDVEGERQQGVENFYRVNHINQTVDFVKKMRREYEKLDKIEMSIWECCELLNQVIDESDPDLDEPQIEHLLQTAEAIRKDYPDQDWLHLTALIHDLGKVLLHPSFGELPQWAVVGDTFPVGCAFDQSIVHHKYFLQNPDHNNPAYNTKCGIYSENCGLNKVMMSWGHDDYMYLVAKENGTSLPSAGLFIIRYHSFYALHRSKAYDHLMNEEDVENLNWLQIFNKYDLYSKSKVRVDVEKVKPYYESLIDKYFPSKLRW